MPDRDRPLVLVSNRGPVTFQEDGSVKRGTGGLVTALTGLASHRDAVWIASAMTDGDAQRPARARRRAVLDRGAARRRVPRALRGVGRRTPTTASTTSSPTRCCGSSSTTCGTRATRRTSAARRSRRSSTATASSTRTWRGPCCRRSRTTRSPSSWSTTTTSTRCRGSIRRERPDVFLHHFIHIPWTQPDAWRVLPKGIRDQIFTGLLANDIVGFHTRSYRRNFLQCCRDLMDLEVDIKQGIVHLEDRDVWVRAYPLPIDYEATREVGRARPRERVRGEAARRGGASSRSCASTARTCRRTSCAASPASTSSSSSTRSSPSGSRSSPS